MKSLVIIILCFLGMGSCLIIALSVGVAAVPASTTNNAPVLTEGYSWNDLQKNLVDRQVNRVTVRRQTSETVLTVFL